MKRPKIEYQLLDNNISLESIDTNFGSICQSYYTKFYREVSYEKLASKSLLHMHKKIEKVCPTQKDSETLELGGGNGEHLLVIPQIYEKYILSDLNQPSTQFYLEKFKNPNLKFELVDAQNIPFETGSFDRVIFTCVLAHVPSIEKTIKEARRVTKVGGKIVLYLPCDPGFFYRFMRYIIPRIRARKRKIELIKDFCDALDHRNSFLNMYYQINWYFRNDEINKYRGPFPGKKLWWQFQAYEINVITKLAN